MEIHNSFVDRVGGHSMEQVSNEGIIPVRKELFVIFVT